MRGCIRAGGKSDERGGSLKELCTLFSRANLLVWRVSDAGWQQTKQVNKAQTQ